jgi:hypothetical protein
VNIEIVALNEMNRFVDMYRRFRGILHLYTICASVKIFPIEFTDKFSIYVDKKCHVLNSSVSFVTIVKQKVNIPAAFTAAMLLFCSLQST